MYRRKRRLFPLIVLILIIVLAGYWLSEVRPHVSGSRDRAQDETAAAVADDISVGEETIFSDEDIIYGSIDGESVPDAAGIPVLPDSDNEPYAYQTLTDEEKLVYGEIVAAFSDRAEEATVSTLEIDVLERAYKAVRCDHCEFFWVEQFGYVTYTRGEELVSIAIRPHYSMTAEEQAELQIMVDEEADRMLADLPQGGSDFDKALYVYETLIREVDYDLNAAYGQTVLSAFLGHATVCQGYSYATQYLLDRLGIPCMTVSGTAEGEAHAWNLVYMDGAWYYIDTTWGNSKYINRYDEASEEIIPYKYVDYDYFGMTTQMMLESHQPDGDIPLPECDAVVDNYYVHNGLYIDSWDPDRIGGILRQGYLDGDHMVRIRFSDAELYAQAMQYFLYDGRVFDWCEGLTSVNYLEGDDSMVMMVVFPSNAG